MPRYSWSQRSRWNEKIIKWVHERIPSVIHVNPFHFVLSMDFHLFYIRFFIRCSLFRLPITSTLSRAFQLVVRAWVSVCRLNVVFACAIYQHKRASRDVTQSQIQKNILDDEILCSRETPHWTRWIKHALHSMLREQAQRREWSFLIRKDTLKIDD